MKLKISCICLFLLIYLAYIQYGFADQSPDLSGEFENNLPVPKLHPAPLHKNQRSLLLAGGVGFLGAMAFSSAAEIFNGAQGVALGSGFLLSAVPAYLFLGNQTELAAPNFVFNTFCYGLWGTAYGSFLSESLGGGGGSSGMFRLAGEAIGVGFGFYSDRFVDQTVTELFLINLNGFAGIAFTDNLFNLIAPNAIEDPVFYAALGSISAAALIPAYLSPRPKHPSKKQTDFEDNLLIVNSVWGGVFGGMFAALSEEEVGRGFSPPGMFAGAALGYIATFHGGRYLKGDWDQVVTMSQVTLTTTLGGYGLGILGGAGNDTALAIGAATGLAAHLGGQFTLDKPRPYGMSDYLYAQMLGFTVGTGIEGLISPDRFDIDKPTLEAGFLGAGLVGQYAYIVQPAIFALDENDFLTATAGHVLGSGFLLGNTLLFSDNRRLAFGSLLLGTGAGMSTLSLFPDRRRGDGKLALVSGYGLLLGGLTGAAIVENGKQDFRFKSAVYLDTLTIGGGFMFYSLLYNEFDSFDVAVIVLDSLWLGWLVGWAQFSIAAKNDERTFLAAMIGADVGAVLTSFALGPFFALQPERLALVSGTGILGLLLGASLVDIENTKTSRYTLLTTALSGTIIGLVASSSLPVRKKSSEVSSRQDRPVSPVDRLVVVPVVSFLPDEDRQDLFLGLRGRY